MKLSQIDEAVKLRNCRRHALEMIDATSGPMYLHFMYAGAKYDPATAVSVDCVRDAIRDACLKSIAAYEKELDALGVTVDEVAP